MKKRLLRISLIGVVIVALVATMLAFVGCGGKKNANLKKPADVFALAGVSTGALLDGMSTSGAAMSEGNMALDDAVVDELNKYMAVVDSLIAGNPEASKTEKSDRADYANVQIMNVPDMTGKWTEYRLYYNEDQPSAAALSEEDEDAEDNETEESEENEYESHITGIMVIGDKEFPVKGDIEVETEADESEQSIEFVAYLDDTKANYIVFEQEAETETEDGATENETEYSYKIYENSTFVESFELEVENESNEAEYSIKTKDNAGNVVKFELEKEVVGDKTIAKVTYKNGTKVGKFTVESTVNEAGTPVYKYTIDGKVITRDIDD